MPATTHEPVSAVFELARRPARARTTVLMVDDFALVGEGLAASFAGDLELEVVGLATDGRTALRLARETRPDVVLVDPCVVLGEVSVVDRLQAEVPSMKAVLLTRDDDPAHGLDERGAAAGMHARVGRSASRAQLRHTLIEVGRLRAPVGRRGRYG